MAEEKSFLEMSDEELMNTAPPVATAAPVKEESEQPPQTEPVVEEENKEPVQEEEQQEEQQEEEQEEQEEEENPPAKPAKTPVKEKNSETDVENPPVQEKKAVETPEKVDADAFMKEILAPFKANGREMQVNTPEEARQLMQMGANYNKKMAGLKPHLALIKQLENNDLLSDEKIGYLIDLYKKNPEAIAKLVKESGVDPMDVDEKAVKDYVPKSYAVDPRQLALDETLDSLKDSEHYTALLETVANEWDAASKNQIADTPQVLQVLNDHKANGIWDLITTEVARQKALGKLPGVPDLRAYQQIGDDLNAKGAFNHLVKKPAATEAPAKKVIPAAKVADKELADKRRAAAPTKSTTAKKAPATFNPLALSDEEFAKLGNPNFL